ncbi:AMP-binding protein [Streptomyces catenulae]|uniref:AMP-binding protein n=1 Tax=Streptomyces catenulae TaxID=66875 RepID=A0ABV2YSR2_9ACTN|nr:AMP-binding protein [Streptomyces catenulae]
MSGYDPAECAGLPPESVPDLATLVERAAARWPDRVAWTFDEFGRDLTFAEVARGVRRTAAELSAAGVGRDGRVAVLLRNRPEFPLTWLALAALGAAMVPVNTAYRSHDAEHVLRDSGAHLLVTCEEFRPLAEELLASVPTLRAVRYVDGSTPPAVPAPVSPGGPSGPGELVNVQYTSGTTGSPKGCLLPHRYWLALAGSLVTEFPHLGPEDTLLTCQPFHYIDPQWNVAAALLAGSRLVVLDRFHPTTFWRKVREHRVTYFYCLGLMPTLLLRMPEHPDDRDHHVRAVQCSAIPPALHSRLEERWGVPWYEAFGMTETGADLRVGPADHDAAVGSGCIGRPLRHRAVRIAGPDGAALPARAVGEIQLRGPGMMAGYLGRPEETAAAFADGWFHTGDLGHLDEEGRVHFRGRLKDMIRRSGENVAAAEVEEVLTAHPRVRLAAVVPVADELRGEEIKAYVVPDGDGPGPGPDELAAHCGERLAAFKVPRYWELRDRLPLTPSERVAKGELRKLPVSAGRTYDRQDTVWR